MRRPLALLVTAAVTAAVVLIGYFNYDVRYAIARVQRDTPEAPVEMYLDALARGSEEEAIAAWRVSAGHRSDELEARRTAVTRHLAARRPAAHRIESVEWWSHCCEPHIIGSRRFATGARFTVWIGDERYRMDVYATVHEQIWDGLPSRGWVLKDVYRAGDPPIWNTWPGR